MVTAPEMYEIFKLRVSNNNLLTEQTLSPVSKMKLSYRLAGCFVAYMWVSHSRDPKSRSLTRRPANRETLLLTYISFFTL